MRQLLEHLDRPNPECKNCEGKGMFGKLSDIPCAYCWRFGYQTGDQAVSREKLALMCSILFFVLEGRHNCPACGGSGLLEGLNKCYCSTDADAALEKLAEEIASATEEILWLSGEKSMGDVIEEVLGV